MPVAGMAIQIEKEKAVHVNINRKSLDPEKFYVIVHSDY